MTSNDWRNAYTAEAKMNDRLAAELAECRAERDALQMTVEESREIHAETVGALAYLMDEPVSPCQPPCPGHLGEKALAMIRKAQDAYSGLRAERDRLRGALRTIELGLDVFVEGDYTYRAIRPYRDAARAALEGADE